MERVTLSLLERSTEPVGSPRLVNAFRNEGIDVAEATAGRYLREMDERGLTTRIGRQGRCITERGRQRLKHLLLVERLDVHSAELVRAVSASDVDEMINVLYLRKAVEGEAARLAAMRATNEERAHIQSLAHQHVDHVAAGEEGFSDALHFHLAIAKATHSPTMHAVIELLIEPINDPFLKVLDIITIDVGKQHAFAHEHSDIIAAILNQDPEGAERAMRRHIDDLIETVQSFLTHAGAQSQVTLDPA